MWKANLITAAALGLAVALIAPAPEAQARDLQDCQLWWGQAARSYLTKNRTKGPEDEVWKAACEIEQRGDLDAARIEAITIAVRELVKLDERGCRNFLTKYVGATLPDQVCSAGRGEDMEALRQMVAGSLPPPPERRAAPQP